VTPGASPQSLAAERPDRPSFGVEQELLTLPGAAQAEIASTITELSGAPSRAGSTGRQRRLAAQKKMAPDNAGAKFEQGGFTSGRRKGPKTLFPGNPGNLYWQQQLPKNRRDVSIACSKYDQFGG
jgi:hypothetical protein